MTGFILRRVIQSIVVMLLTSILVFFSMRLLPGDPILMLLTENQAQELNEEQINQMRREFGLDKPLVIQYFGWITGIFRGDLGISILHRAPVTREISQRMPISAYLGGLAFIIGHLIGIPAGVIAAVRRGKWMDTTITTLANVGITLPNFLLGLLLVYIFGLKLNWLPIMGYTSPFTDFNLSFKQAIMPVFCLALFPIAGSARQTRSSMLEVMGQDFIRTAWSKGLKERVIIMRHALKNGLIPIVTLAGMGVPMIIGGAVFIETIFNIPGIGRLIVSSVSSQDYPYVQAITLLISAIVVTTNLIVDITYGWLDPRTRHYK